MIMGNLPLHLSLPRRGVSLKADFLGRETTAHSSSLLDIFFKNEKFFLVSQSFLEGKRTIRVLFFKGKKTRCKFQKKKRNLSFFLKKDHERRRFKT